MAAMELIRVRSSFVDKVSEEVIDQLLDSLLLDGVVDDGEKESIIKENKTSKQRARSLIDKVRNRGDTACGKMIAHIQRRDPLLFTELGLSCGSPAPPGPQKEQEGTTSLKRSTEAFWREKQNDKNFYPVPKKSIVNRVALLITNIEFTDKELNRNGAEKDEESMEKLLTDLGYEVVKHTNLTGKEIDEAVIKFSKHPKLRETDSVVVVMMSHGKLGAILGVNWKEKTSEHEEPDEFLINQIYKCLGSEECPALLDKPKIIIVQACRGGMKGAVLVSDGPHPALLCDDMNQSACLPAREEDIEEDTVKYVHREKDFITLLSCTPETVSYRLRGVGSFLIQYVAEVFNTCAHQDDIEELFRKVMQRFEDFSLENKRQMPTKDRCTLTKRFFFFPGL